VWTGGQRVCRYDTIRTVRPLLCLIFLSGVPLFPQSGGDPIAISTDHPRLLLRPARLRLLRRERERKSPRWLQFEAYVAGQAPMPEQGLARALYYQISGDADAGRRAAAWALGGESDTRQQAMVFDWCQEALTEAQRRDLTARLEKAITAPPADDSIATARTRAMAAIVLYDHVPRTPQRELERLVRTWWEGKMAPALNSGRSVVTRDEAYPLYELLHAMRDNTLLDLRESAAGFFKEFPIEHLISYYPATYPGPDTEYHIGAERKIGEPDLQLACLARTAELAMVAFDTNAQSTQVLQGWLMHDRFMLRSTFGAPYEFLWANPYQPGLSYYLVPLVYYNADFGHLFVRSNWEENAKWFGYFDGVTQIFEDGHATLVDPQRSAPLSLEEAVICLGQTARKFYVTLEEDEPAFIVGLEPRHTYLVEIDDEEMYEAVTDPGGILQLELPRGKEVGVRLK